MSTHRSTTITIVMEMTSRTGTWSLIEIITTKIPRILGAVKTGVRRITTIVITYRHSSAAGSLSIAARVRRRGGRGRK